MAFRNKKMTMPSIDDIIMQIMAMSEAFYEGDWTIGWSTWDIYRPPTWPTAKYLLKFYGYPESNSGWNALVADHIGIDCKTLKEIRIEQGQDRERRRWGLNSKPDYTTDYNEAEAAIFDRGLAICKATYERTGRMILR